MVRPRRTLALGIALIASLLSLAACGGTVPRTSAAPGPAVTGTVRPPSPPSPRPPSPTASGAPAPSGPTQGGAAQGGAAQGSPTQGGAAPGGAAPGSTTRGGATSGSPAPVGFPGAPRAYAEAVLAAWAQGQQTRLADLTTPLTRGQLGQLSAVADQRWTYQRCDGAAGSSYCSFLNTDGDAVTLRVLDQQVGRANAVAEMKLDRTAYPLDAREYVKGFVEAWRNGNQPRLQALASPAEVRYFTGFTPPDTYSVCTFASGQAWQVRVFNSNGLNYLVRVSTMALGTQHAIVGHIDPAPVPPPCS